ncbi:MAG TPA: hypothetical protein VFE48_04475 [Methylomirabilota bacterium]|nr:hypothetical protein [Methylomirabilota bacterium]
MTLILALFGIAAVVFSVLVGVVQTVSTRRQQRHMKRQWEERERLLDRRSVGDPPE